MPHSSGGGSSGGGGTYSGSSSYGGGSSQRYSRTYFPDSDCYYYYDRRNRLVTYFVPHGFVPTGKPNFLIYIFILIFMAVGGGTFFFSSYSNPKKLDTNYDTTIVIQDNLNVINEHEEELLNSAFHTFVQKSGITPSLVTIDYNDWTGHYSTISDYAFDKYVSMFKDESHWLLVYSQKQEDKNRIFEGMQGNDTDGVLTVYKTKEFNQNLYDYLSDSSLSVGQSIIKAFDQMIPTLMDKSFHVELQTIIFVSVWEAICLTILVFAIIGDSRNKKLKTAAKFEGKPTRKKCEYCDSEYIEGTIDRCPNCGAFLGPITNDEKNTESF